MWPQRRSPDPTYCDYADYCRTNLARLKAFETEQEREREKMESQLPEAYRPKRKRKDQDLTRKSNPIAKCLVNSVKPKGDQEFLQHEVKKISEKREKKSIRSEHHSLAFSPESPFKKKKGDGEGEQEREGQDYKTKTSQKVKTEMLAHLAAIGNPGHFFIADEVSQQLLPFDGPTKTQFFQDFTQVLGRSISSQKGALGKPGGYQNIYISFAPPKFVQASTGKAVILSFDMIHLQVVSCSPDMLQRLDKMQEKLQELTEEVKKARIEKEYELKRRDEEIKSRDEEMRRREAFEKKILEEVARLHCKPSLLVQGKENLKRSQEEEAKVCNLKINSVEMNCSETPSVCSFLWDDVPGGVPTSRFFALQRKLGQTRIHGISQTRGLQKGSLTEIIEWKTPANKRKRFYISCSYSNVAEVATKVIEFLKFKEKAQT